MQEIPYDRIGLFSKTSITKCLIKTVDYHSHLTVRFVRQFSKQNIQNFKLKLHVRKNVLWLSTNGEMVTRKDLEAESCLILTLP